MESWNQMMVEAQLMASGFITNLVENGKMKKLKVPESPFTYDIEGERVFCVTWFLRFEISRNWYLVWQQRGL